VFFQIRRGSANLYPAPEERLIKLINSSTHYVNGAFYDISSIRVAEAFVNASKRGVKVRLVTDSDNLPEKLLNQLLMLESLLLRITNRDLCIISSQ
jgi:phosphatidylserine/phosphatidylglycerophosphate/cardiolipin synthase-like enzyme